MRRQAVQQEASDSETAYRALVALGNIVRWEFISSLPILNVWLGRRIAKP